MTTPTTPPPPEASLIRLAREAAGLSPEKAAARMEIRFSGSRWRQIEAGRRADSDQPVIAKSPTLAHMAHSVGVTSDRLAAAGREDAAEILREIESAGAEPEPAYMPGPLAGLEDWQRRAILNILDERPRSKREKALVLRTLVQELEHQATQEDPPELRKVAGDA
jgi:transcriptional regulator with XRE-family HTH domain